jgi:curved DNA-binding protein
MAVEYKDYYEILGVEPGAADDEIRRAFRSLARQYHPDKSGGDRLAEDRFKEINEAYEVLGDPSRRRRYDEFNTTWYASPSAEEAWRQFSQSGFDPSGPETENHTRSNGFSDFFSQLFGERQQEGPRYRPRPHVRTREEVEAQTKGRGDDLESDIFVTLEEVATGGVRPINMRRLERCPTCYGVGQYNAHKCEQCSGNGNFLRSETYKVKVPKGIKEGAFLRIQGHGEKGLGNGPAGDLYLKVHYAAHPSFKVEGGQLIHVLEVAPWEAVLGTVVVVPTLDGRATIKIPAGTRSGDKLRLREKGLPGDDSSPADLIVEVKVQVPTNAPARERQLWEELARTSAYNPRDN